MKHITLFLVMTFLAAHIALSVYSIRANSPTCDEVAHHIPEGYSYLVKKDFRLNPSNPPLTRELSAIPLLFMKLKVPFDDQIWHESKNIEFGRKFFYKYNNNADSIIFWSRIPSVVLSLILGFFVFIWSKALYGSTAGLLSIFLYLFCPNTIAFSSLAGNDLGISVFFFLTIYSFWQYRKRPNIARLFISGTMFGLALGSKYSSIILFPIIIAVAAANYWKTQNNSEKRPVYGFIKDMCLIFLIGILVLWTLYFFEFKPLLKNAPDVPEKIAYISSFYQKYIPETLRATKEGLIKYMNEVPLPLTTYIVGLFGVVFHGAAKVHPQFLLGNWSTQGWWYYYPVAFLIKTPIPMLLLLLVAALFYKSSKRKNIMDELMVLLPPALFFIASIFGRPQLGIRYILPIYPFLCVFAGRLVTYELCKKYAWKVFIFILCFWYFIGALIVSPHYLAYFNEFIGGPDNGYKYLRDSNLDWGQGLKGLKRYMDKNNIKEIKLSYFGEADPEYYKIRYSLMSDTDRNSPTPGIYAISAQYLDAYAWTRRIKPEDKIGYSIFIYKIEKGLLSNE